MMARRSPRDMHRAVTIDVGNDAEKVDAARQELERIAAASANPPRMKRQ
jgi:hypothetical protein